MLEENDLLEIKKMTINLRNKFKLIETKEWSFKKGCMEFIVQLGHLAQVLINEKTYNEKGRNINNAENEIADCFLQIIALMIYFQWDNEQIFFSLKYEKQNNVLIKLLIVSSQLLESIMRIDKDRFPTSRKPHYPSEREFINQKLGEAMKLLLLLSREREISLKGCFNEMYRDAISFLDCFNDQSESCQDAVLQYEEVNRCFNPQAFIKKV